MVGHGARMDARRNAYMVFVVNPEGEIRSFGKPIRRLKDNTEAGISRNRITWRELSSSRSE